METHLIGAAMRAARSTLHEAGIETASLDAEVLMRHLLGMDRARLFASLNDPLTPNTYEAFQRLLGARAAGTPVAYLIGEREFMGLPFFVTPAVLIPRPETEILVEWALHWLRGRDEAIVADIGTGSGAIALSIAAAMDATWRGHMIATDTSSDALAVAQRNRERLALPSRVELRQGSLLAPLIEQIDLLLANLPYLRPDQISANPDLSAEPRLALDGGEAGLDQIRALLADAPRVLALGGAVGLEIDPAQRNDVIALATKAFPSATIDVLPDLAGLDRHIVVQTLALE
jgi:release factor glutamine methyltransferase